MIRSMSSGVDGVVDGIQLAVVAVSLVLAVVVVAYVALDRRPDRVLVGALGLLEVLLVALLVAGVVRVAGDDGSVATWEYVGYLVGILLPVPVGTWWAKGEPTRSGTAVLLVALLVVPFLVLRLQQIWEAGHLA